MVSQGSSYSIREQEFHIRSNETRISYKKQLSSSINARNWLLVSVEITMIFITMAWTPANKKKIGCPVKTVWVKKVDEKVAIHWWVGDSRK